VAVQKYADAEYVSRVRISEAMPELRLTESDQLDPAGRWRFRADGNKVYFEKATAAAWASYDSALLMGSFGATCFVVASDAKTEIKNFAQLLQYLGYPVWVCNGTDDNIEIRAAIDALPSSGGRVLLSEGTFNLGDEILIDFTVNADRNLVLSGVGWGTKLYNGQTDGGHAVHLYSSGVVGRWVWIEKMRIEGNANTGDGIYFEHLGSGGAIEQCVLRDLNVYSHGGQGIHLKGQVAVIDLYSVYSESNGSNGFYAESNADGLKPRGISIYGGRWNSNGSCGIDQGATLGMTLIRPWAESNGDYGIKIGNRGILIAPVTEGNKGGETNDKGIYVGNNCVAFLNQGINNDGYDKAAGIGYYFIADGTFDFDTVNPYILNPTYLNINILRGNNKPFQSYNAGTETWDDVARLHDSGRFYFYKPLLAGHFYFGQRWVKKTVNYNDTSPVTVVSLPAKSIVTDIIVEVRTAWNGATPGTIDIGDASDADGFMTNAQIDPTVTGWKGQNPEDRGAYLYDSVDNHVLRHVYSSATDVIATLVVNDSTQGVADIYLGYVVVE